MIRFKQFLTELTYQDITPGKGKWKHTKASVFGKYDSKNRNLSDEVFELIKSTYAAIGGHIDFQKAMDLPSNHTDWSFIDIDVDPEPDIVKFGKKTKFGKKSTGVATDGTPEAKMMMLKDKVKALAKLGNYAEVSDAIAHILITRHNVAFVDNVADVQKVLGGGKKIKWVGEHPSGKYPNHKGWYSRSLGGASHLKIMVGRPKL